MKINFHINQKIIAIRGVSSNSEIKFAMRDVS